MQHILDFMSTSLTDSDLAESVIGEVVPDGWIDLVWQAKRLITLMPESFMQKIAVDKGLLRIIGDCKLEMDQVIFDKFAQSLARDSSTMCMECGKRGFRRKEEDGWPSLCGVHYVEYVNFLDSKNRG